MTLETSTSCTPRRWTPGSFLRQKALDPLDEVDPLDRLWEQSFDHGEDVDDDEKVGIFDVDEYDKAHALQGEKHHCDVDGLLRLNGTINVEKERIYVNCRRVGCSRRCLQSVCAFAFLSSLSTGVVVRSEALDKALRGRTARCTMHHMFVTEHQVKTRKHTNPTNKQHLSTSHVFSFFFVPASHSPGSFSHVKKFSMLPSYLLSCFILLHK